MTSKPFIIVIFYALLLSSCHYYTHKINPSLLFIEDLMNQFPDSSLVILENDCDIANFNDENLAYFYLLLVENSYKTGKSLLPYDSLITWTTRFYNKNKKKDMEARAWLNKGRINYELDQFEDMLTSFQKAKKSAKRGNDDSIIYNINDELGEIYTEAGLYEEALEIYYNNYYIQERVGNINNMVLSLRNIGYTHFFIDQPDSAFYYLEKGLDIAKQSNDSTDLTDLIYKNMSVYYYQKQEYKISLEKILMTTKENYSSQLMKGILFYEINACDSSKYYLMQALQSDFIYIQASALLFLSRIEEEKNNYKYANEYLQRYNYLQDSISKSTKTLGINLLNHNYNLKTTTLKFSYSSYIFISFLLFIITILSLIYFSFIKEKTKKEKIERQRKEIIKLKEEIKMDKEAVIHQKESRQKKENHIHSLIENNSTLLYQKIDELQCKIFKSKEIYSIIKELSNQKEVNEYNKRILNIRDREILRKEIFSCFPEFIESITASCPKIKEDDITLCCLSKLGLKLNTISLCFGFIKSEPIRQRKYQLKKKMIEEYNCPEIFDYIFSQKKT